MSTKKCSKCKMEIDSKATKCPYCGSSQGMSCSGMLGALVFIVVIIGVLGAIGNSRDSSSKPNTSAPTTTASTTSVPSDNQTETSKQDDTIWFDKKLGLCQVSEKVVGEIDSIDFIHIYGAVGNASKNDYSYIQITYSIYDENGIKTGDAFTNTLGLKSGEIWKFEATGNAGGGSRFRFDSIEAY